MDINDDFTYDTSSVEGFLVPAGTVIEVYATTEDRLITAKNKWLIAHEDADIEGAFCGLKGENITL